MAFLEAERCLGWSRRRKGQGLIEEVFACLREFFELTRQKAEKTLATLTTRNP